MNGFWRRGVFGRRTPWREANWCVIDIETTGLDRRRDAVISFAAVPIRQGRIVAGAAVSSLVRPVRDPSPESVRIHGLRAADLVTAPPAADVVPLLVDALAGAVLVAHHAPVERDFLSPLFAEAGARFPRYGADTEVLGRLWLHDRDGGRRPHLSLSDLARELGLPIHRPHDAMGDALTTAQAFIALAAHLEHNGQETVGTLTRADRRLANTHFS